MTIGRIPSVEGGIQPTILDAKGDLITATAADTAARLAVGTNGQVLQADSTTATGLKWATVSTTPSFVGCALSNTTNTTANDSTNTLLLWNTEIYDTNNFHSTSTNTSRVTIPTGYAGAYSVTAQLQAVNNSSANEAYLRSAVWKNGSPYGLVQTFTPGTASKDFTVTYSAIMNLAVGDYIEFYVRSQGGNATVQGTNSFDQATTFQVIYLGA